jgi:hypothetical protein
MCTYLLGLGTSLLNLELAHNYHVTMIVKYPRSLNKLTQCQYSDKLKVLFTERVVETDKLV